LLAGFIFFQKKKKMMKNKKTQKREKENSGFITCSEQERRKENFTLFGRLNDDRQKFFKYFRMGFSKFENLK
jgi:hypothetical protein